MNKQRPLSPHLTIYHMPLNAVMSILHRLTGIGLFFSLLIFTWWLCAVIFSDFDAKILSYADSWLFKILAFLSSFAFCYHLCTGIRHLFWDSGKGFKVGCIDRSNWLILIVVILMFSASWFFIIYG